MWIVLAFGCLPLLYYLCALETAWRFFRQRPPADDRGFVPPISVLKPVRGLDRHAFENFASFCGQDYPTYEILFAVADEDDPAIAVIHRLMDRFPRQAIRLVVGVPELGPSSKVNKLCRLVREARFDLLVVSDSDISVPPGYLRAVAAPFRDPQVGAVTCLYRGASDGRLVSDLEAIGISTDFAAGVLVARRLEGVSFALGATMATTRARLAEIGGFEALVECCADDYELGHRIATRGHRVALADCIVSTECAAGDFGDLVRHEFRWAVTLRHSRPFGYAGRMLVGQAFPWSLVAAAVARPPWMAGAFVSAYLVLRLTLAWVVGLRGLGDRTVRRRWWLVPMYDAIHILVLLAACCSSRIEWRGRVYELHRGKLAAIRTSTRDPDRTTGYLRT